MALIKNSFFEQVSLATIRKKLKNTDIKELEFWEAEINFEHNKSGFEFNILEPEQNKMKKNYLKPLSNKFCETFEKDPNRRGIVKRFWNKKDAEYYILFNLMQIYKPLNEYIIKHDILSSFNDLMKEYPEKILKEFGKGTDWLVD